MRIFSKTKKQKELRIVFDVGSSSVGGAAFWSCSGEAPQIVFSTRQPISFERSLDFDRFLAETAKSLSMVAEKIFSAKLGKPARIFCVLSSPWYSSQIRTISLHQEKPFTFTAELADKLIQKEIMAFNEESNLKHPQAKKFELLEFKNMKLKLNGYPTHSPLEQQAKELEMSIFVSMTAERVLRKIKGAISKHFNCSHIEFSSLMMVSFVVARNTFVQQDSFLLVDIDGEITEIAMVKKDTLCSSISFPTGRNFLIRGLSNALNCSLDEAMSYFSLYKNGHIAGALEKKVEPVIEELKSEWLRKFQESLINLTNDISIPATVFVIIDQDLAEFFAEIIRVEEFNQYTLTESKFRIIFLGKQSLHGLANFSAGSIRDSFLTIESIYFNNFSG